MASTLVQTKFNKRVEKIILSLGGSQVYVTTEGYQRFVIPTKAGELSVSVHSPRVSKLFSIFASFEDVDRARELLSGDGRLNRHSGKLNFHTSDDKECLRVFLETISAII